MASTYSTNLKIELIGTGDQSGTWGATTNTNLGTLLEQAIAGYVTQAVTDGAATVLTIPNGVSSNGRNYVIELTGTLTANRTVEVPAVNKPYIFFNNTTGGFSVTVKVSGQTGVTIANGKKAIVYTNTTDVIEVANAPVTEAGTQTLTNKTLTNPTINGFTGNTAVVNIGSGQIYKDTSGNVGIGTTSPSYPLDVRSSGAVAAHINAQNGNGSILYGVDASGATYAWGTSGGNFYTGTNAASGNTLIYAGGSERVRIDTSGNVGIGTSSPGYKLDVNGGIRMPNATVFWLNNSSGTATEALQLYSDNNTYFSTPGSLIFRTNGTTERARISAAGGFVVGSTTDPGAGKIADSIGNVRSVPVNSQTTGYTLVATDAGKYISITTGGVTVPASVFSVGDSVTIYNDSSSNQTITQGGSVTMYLVGTATTGNRTLAQRGLATVFCVGTNTFVITGGGLT